MHNKCHLKCKRVQVQSEELLSSGSNACAELNNQHLGVFPRSIFAMPTLPRSRLRGPSALSLAELLGTCSQFYRSKQGRHSWPAGPASTQGLEAAVRAPRSGQSLSPRNPHRGLCSGRGACLLRWLRNPDANCSSGRADTARLFRRGEATPGSCGVDLAPTPRVGRREISTLAREVHSLEGGSQGHDLASPGPPATLSGLSGTQMGLIQGLPPARLPEP